MRSGRLILSSMLFILVGAPFRADALNVVVVASRPGGPTPAPSVKLQSVINPVPGTQTTINLSDIRFNGVSGINGFTFTPTAGGTTLPLVISDVSGGVERVYMNNTTITAPSTSCTATAPCTLTLTASSDLGDFAKKSIGGFPSGISVSAFMVRSDGRTAAAGNTLTVTGRAQAATGLDPINTTPGAGVGDTPNSLPKACSGKTTCKFTAALTNGGSFNEQLSETIQLNCATPPCDPAKTFTFTITFTRPLDRVTFGVGIAQSTTTAVSDNFVGALLPQFNNFSAKLEIVKGSKFQLKVPFTLNAGTNGINPLAEFVNFSLTPKTGSAYSGTIPPGSFKTQKPKPDMVFVGTVNNAKVDAKIIPLGGPRYEFRADVSGSGLLVSATNPVCIALTIEDDTSGSNCVKAELK